MILLREVKPSDKNMLRTWRNLPGVNRYLYNDHEISTEEHNRWFQGVFTDPSRRYWIISCDEEDVGVAYLYNIDLKNQRCYWAFYLASPNTRGKGIGSFVEYSILKHVFDDMKLQKLCAEVLAFNEPVTNMHKGFGFVEEGRFRKHIYKGGQFDDIICVAMLKEDWETKRPEIEERLRRKGLIPFEECISCP